MKALTVQQPWAWAIVHGGKDVENRTQAWSYRGPLAIHAGARLSQRGCELVPDLLDATRPDLLAAYAAARLDYGAIIGVVDLVNVHDAWPGYEVATIGGTVDRSEPCCSSSWSEFGDTLADRLVHLELANPRPLPAPIPCKGRLGLWTPPADVLAQLQAVAG